MPVTTSTRLLHANDPRAEHARSAYAADAGDAGPPRAAVERHLDADVCIVGAGLTGLGAALTLARAGRDVVVLDAHRAGWGASGRNGGQLGSGWNIDQAELEAMLGQRRARELWRMAEDAKAWVHELAAEHRIAIGYRPGIVVAAHRPRHVARLHAQARHLRTRYAHDAIEPLSASAVRALVDSPSLHGGWIDRGAGHLDPLALTEGLARAAEVAGARLFERSEAIRIETVPARARRGRRVVTPGGSVRAAEVVVACNGYLDRLLPRHSRHVMPINNFMLATEPLGARAAALLPGNHAVADTRFVVDYFRRSADDRLLFGGGETYGYRFPPDIGRRVRRAMLRVFPQLADVAIERAWGGTLAITANRLPRVRELEPGLFVAGGYSGHGLALAAMTGRVIAEAITGDRSRLSLLEALPARAFPGGPATRPVLLAAAMTGAAWRDRL